MNILHVLSAIKNGSSEERLKMKLIEYIKQLDNNGYTALEILEELTKRSWVVEITIGTGTINEEPYQKSIYYVEIGRHCEDEGESTYFESDMFGCGDNLIDAIRYMYKFKVNENIYLYVTEDEDNEEFSEYYEELKLQEDNLKEYKTEEDIFIENLDNASNFTPYEFVTEHKNPNIITTDYFERASKYTIWNGQTPTPIYIENNFDNLGYFEKLKKLLEHITPNNLIDFNMINFEIFGIGGECSLVTIIKEDKNRYTVYSGTDTFGIQSEVLFKYINNLIKHKNIHSVEVKRIWEESTLFLKIKLNTFTLY